VLRDTTEFGEKQTLDLAENLVQTTLQGAKADAQYLAEISSLFNWLNTTSEATLEYLQADLLHFSSRKQIYDQIRVIDLGGKEQLRINKSENTFVVAPLVELQEKRNRYYVEAGLKLRPEQVYASPLDLNIENNEIELPIKPMIRFVAPIYGHAQPIQGQFNEVESHLGMVVLNYLGRYLLDSLRSLGKSSAGDIWLLNDSGDWLIGPTGYVEWGFMYPNKTIPNFAARYPDAWQHIVSKRSGHLRTSLGFISFKTIGWATDFQISYQWHLLTVVPDGQYGMPASALSRYALIAILLTFILAWICYLVALKERARQLSLKRIEIERSRYRDLLESAPDGIIIVYRNGVITLANAEAEHEFGYSSGELIGSSIERLVPKRQHSQHQIERNNFIENPITRPMGNGRVLFGVRKDNTEFPVEVSLSSTTIDGIQSVTAIVRDVTAREERESNIRNLNNTLHLRTHELEIMNSELESFSYSVSHDLRAPLRALDGFSLTILNDYSEKLDDRGRDRLARIRAAAQKMASLIDDLLKLSRISRTEMTLESVYLSAIAQQLFDEIEQHESSPQTKIVIQKEMLVVGDSALLKIALTNLIANAWKFSRKTLNPSIYFGQELQQGKSAFYIRDNGAGFDMDHASKLFGAFQRLHDNNEFSGTGIGLATVKRIIHLHHGEIWAQGEVGKGATFYFTINFLGEKFDDKENDTFSRR
jgi:PAS domain S-box-containing protein